MQDIAERGPERLIRGVIFDGDACSPPQFPWLLSVEGKPAGHITSAAWSPRFEQNVGLGMLERDYWKTDTPVQVNSADGISRQGVVVDLPMEER